MPNFKSRPKEVLRSSDSWTNEVYDVPFARVGYRPFAGDVSGVSVSAPSAE